MLKLVILRGLPGSGKTTWREAHYPDAPCVDVEDCYPDGPRTRSTVGWAHAEADRRLYDALAHSGADVVISERCHLTRFPVDLAFDMARYCGYDVEVVSMPPTPASRYPLRPGVDWAGLTQIWETDPSWIDAACHTVVGASE